MVVSSNAERNVVFCRIVSVVLPRFEVTVNPPPFIVSDDTSIEGTVTARSVHSVTVSKVM